MIQPDTHTPYHTGDTIRLDDYALHVEIGAALLAAGYAPSHARALRVARVLSWPRALWWVRLIWRV